MNLKASRFLDPKSDLVFKKIFGENADLVKSFLNSILPLSDDALIDEITYMTPEQVPTIPTMRRTIVDVKCRDQKGRIFIVDMQLDWSANFMKRLQFGTAKAYVSQLDRGQDYSSLCPVYGLGLVGEIFDHETDEWYHHYKTVNMQNTEKQLDGLELIFVELPKFKSTTHMERKLGILWIRFLNEIASMSDVPKEFSEVPELCKAIELTQEASYTKGELEAYDQYWDAVSTEKTRTVDAMAKGKAEGIAAGVAQVVIEMLNEKFSDAIILKLAKISREELQQIKKSLHNLNSGSIRD